jgi:23S rRNA (cytidine1920-2'-O)/16S rRNA (cytidine1409-2'-O)-methyltransferase
MRLDKYLVENGYFESRNRAINAIKSNLIFVNKKMAKASTKIDKDSNIEIKESKFYISRAGEKLEGFLKESNLDIRDKIALDIGSSKGGFTQILLEYGVKSVDCVDVGSNQLHHLLRNNPKIDIFEKEDIRGFKSSKNYNLITCDVSFISILSIIDDIDRLAKQDIIILYKPQFEVGREAKRDKRGVVQDIQAIERARENFIIYIQKLNWRLIDIKESTIYGKNGNLEYIYYFIKE